MTDPYAQAANQRPAQPPPSTSAVDERVHAILASLGGDLLSTYGGPAMTATHPDAPMLATLGGYLTQRYGRKPTPSDQEPTA